MMDGERYVDARRLWTCELGAGTPMLLANGGPGCCDYLEPVAELLTDDARTIRFEPGGCGRSSMSTHSTPDQCFADVEAIRRSHGLERLFVVGHS